MKKYKYLYFLCFIMAFSLRVFMIFHTPEMDDFIDTVINRDMGQLVTNRINPYDFNDKPELRHKLRTDNNNYNSYLCKDQKTWNFYSSSNLPLNIIFLGGVEYLFPSYTGYRLTIAFFDSFLAVIILVLVLKKWHIILPLFGNFKNSPFLQKIIPILIGFALGAISPVLLMYSTIITETKGIELLLILVALYFSYSSDLRKSLLLSPILLGFSVSFMALGFFIAPLCLYNVYMNGKNGINDKKKVLIYCLISFISCVIWIIPFMPELLSVMTNRIADSSQSNSVPKHSSIWVATYQMFPYTWTYFKNVLIVLFSILIIIGVYKKRLNAALVSSIILLIFTTIYLINGSLDRVNIALLTTIIILGCNRNTYFASVLSLFYIWYGIYALHYYSIHDTFNEDNDRIFIIVFTVTYSIFIIKQIFNNNLSDYTVKQLHRVKQILFLLLIVLFVLSNLFIRTFIEYGLTGNEILFKVGMGKLDPTKVKLTFDQKKEIISLISADTNNFNVAQKSLIK